MAYGAFEALIQQFLGDLLCYTERIFFYFFLCFTAVMLHRLMTAVFKAAFLDFWPLGGACGVIGLSEHVLASICL